MQRRLRVKAKARLRVKALRVKARRQRECKTIRFALRKVYKEGIIPCVVCVSVWEPGRVRSPKSSSIGSCRVSISQPERARLR